VIRREGQDCTAEELREFCATHLGKFKAPKAIHFVAELPRGPSGKVQRLKLVELL
jgi:acyl-coenzyme A synthetase/AMP-(fatty) acid ligase